MGKKGYLIDTNIAIEYIGEVLPDTALSMIDDVVDGQFFISVINKIELLGFAGITKYEELKFHELINAADVLVLDNETVDRTIQIRKNNKTKLPDAIIAATALVNNLTIISRNKKDFDKIEGLEVINKFFSITFGLNTCSP